MKKKIGFAAALVIIIGAIIYLESIKTRPAAPGMASENISASSTNTTSTGTNGGPLTLRELAQQDQQAGYAPALEIANPTGFVNASSSFKLADLVGKKIVLLDFWTYSCINCIRTIPYLNAWYQRYASQGLEIVGIHTPEFEFEKDYQNVSTAVMQDGIKYPVVLDSNYGTWQAYHNLYWPHEYLIDMAGFIVHDQIGEGNYDKTEAEIQKLLAQRSAILGTAAPAMPTSTVFVPGSIISNGVASQETYFGAARNEFLGNGDAGVTGQQDFALPSSAPVQGKLYLKGNWNVVSQYAETTDASGQIWYGYQAQRVYFVAGTAGDPVTVEVLVDGKPLDAASAGADVFFRNGRSYVTIQGERLYKLVSHRAAENHLLEIVVPAAGLQAYTFTFG